MQYAHTLEESRELGQFKPKPKPRNTVCELCGATGKVSAYTYAMPRSSVSISVRLCRPCRTELDV